MLATLKKMVYINNTNKKLVFFTNVPIIPNHT